MSFEFKIKQKQVFNAPKLNAQNKEELLEKLADHLRFKEKLDIQKHKNSIICHSNRSVLYYNYKSIYTIEKEKDVVVYYEYDLIPVFKITVIMILFAAFFSRFSINSLLIFSGVFVLVFFAFNIIHINSVLKHIVLSAFAPEKLNYEEILTEEQKEWIKNPGKCPACGEEISEYNYICPECGISINKKNVKRNMNVSAFYDIKFQYKHTKQVKNRNN